jgi:hypothetical protein
VPDIEVIVDPATDEPATARPWIGVRHRCRRSGRLDARAPLGRHGDLPLNTVRRRLRCSACGARDAELVRSTRRPP